ncbi:MAG: helix-turn-helix transcriptional regulator [Clostridia bacterium]|nr:helix-turn-helix transcriptional regulator [Clostridia bacterium]
MYIRNTSLCEKVNQLQLFMLVYGRAMVDKNWQGEIVDSSFTFLYYIVNGSAVVETENGVMELTAGHWYLLPSRCRFLYRCDDYMDHLFFHIKLCHADRLDLLYHCQIPLTADLPAPPEYAFRNLKNTDDVIGALRVRHFVYETVLSMLEANGITLKMAFRSEPVIRAVEYINQHLSASLTTTEIAEHAFVSKSTLTKHFKKELSMSVQEYLYDILLSEASRMLLKGNRSVLEISERLGFSDQFYFSRRFKAKYGTSPREYKKMFS